MCHGTILLFTKFKGNIQNNKAVDNLQANSLNMLT